MPKRSSTSRAPTDLNQLAKAVADQAVGLSSDSGLMDKGQAKAEKNPAAVALGALGGKKGGVARAQKLTAEQRKEIAKKAAAARWNR